MLEGTMHDPPKPGRTHAENEHSAGGAAAGRDARVVRWPRFVSTLGFAGSAVLAVALLWLIGRAAVPRALPDDDEFASTREDPLPGFPRASPAAEINNAIARSGLVVNLDGTAVAYTAEADGLVGDDGQFRTGLSLAEAARILHRDPRTICRKDAPDELDPDAVLFRAQAGTILEESKKLARKLRFKQLQQGLPPDAAAGRWHTRDFAFTLNRIAHPDEEEETILAAISRSRRGVIPRPGDTIRAVAVDRGDLERGTAVVTPGMLPPERPMDRRGTGRSVVD
jgi:hypothetical protein